MPKVLEAGMSVKPDDRSSALIHVKVGAVDGDTERDIAEYTTNVIGLLAQHFNKAVEQGSVPAVLAPKAARASAAPGEVQRADARAQQYRQDVRRVQEQLGGQGSPPVDAGVAPDCPHGCGTMTWFEGRRKRDDKPYALWKCPKNPRDHIKWPDR